MLTGLREKGAETLIRVCSFALLSQVPIRLSTSTRQIRYSLKEIALRQDVARVTYLNTMLEAVKLL